MELVPARNRFNKLLCSTIFPYTNVCVKFDIFIPIPESLVKVRLATFLIYTNEIINFVTILIMTI